MHHGLTDPPHRCGLKVRVAGWIETPCRFDEPEVTFVNQVEQRHAEPAKPFCIMHDDAQVGLHETAERIFVTVLLELLAELTFIIRRERWKI